MAAWHTGLPTRGSCTPRRIWSRSSACPIGRRLRRCGKASTCATAGPCPADVELLEAEPALPERPVPIRFRKNVPTAWLRLSITEGRNRQVRRMTAAVGHRTLRLVRVAVGPVSLGDLAPGQWRELGEKERIALDEMRRKSPLA